MGKIPENFSILEEQIDIITQMSYFEDSKKVKRTKQDKTEIMKRTKELLDENVDNKTKKHPDIFG